MTLLRFYVSCTWEVLKQNLLVKQMMRKRQKQPLVSEKLHEHELHRQNENVVDTIVDIGHNSELCINDNRNQSLKQEKLERNRYYFLQLKYLIAIIAKAYLYNTVNQLFNAGRQPNGAEWNESKDGNYFLRRIES